MKRLSPLLLLFSCNPPQETGYATDPRVIFGTKPKDAIAGLNKLLPPSRGEENGFDERWDYQVTTEGYTCRARDFHGKAIDIHISFRTIAKTTLEWSQDERSTAYHLRLLDYQGDTLDILTWRSGTALTPTQCREQAEQAKDAIDILVYNASAK